MDIDYLENNIVTGGDALRNTQPTSRTSGRECIPRLSITSMRYNRISLCILRKELTLLKLLYKMRRGRTESFLFVFFFRYLLVRSFSSL